jgi:hypothetical protein
VTESFGINGLCTAQIAKEHGSGTTLFAPQFRHRRGAIWECVMRQGKIALLLTAGVAVLLMMDATSSAETVKYEVDLKGSAEVPPSDSSGTGKADVTFDTDSKKLSWETTYSGLSGEPTAAHFHGPAEPGKNAGPVVDISGNVKQGSADLTAEQAADLQAGKWYLNIHTEKYPDGEIRGQVAK